MDSIAAKRDWIYAGLAHPSRVILANSPRGPGLPAGSRIVLLGDEHAAGLGPFLGKLALDSKLNLRFEWERGALAEHWLSVETAERVRKTKPFLVVATFSTKEADPAKLAKRLADFKKALGATMFRWILPFEPSAAAQTLALSLPAADVLTFHSHLLEVHRSPTGAPSARGYAGWAGAVWKWIR